MSAFESFLNFAFDSRDLMTMWLVGLPQLRRTFAMRQHAPLAMRIAPEVHLEPWSERQAFAGIVKEAPKTLAPPNSCSVTRA